MPSLEGYVQVAHDALRVTVGRRSPGLDYWADETLTEPEHLLRLDGLGFSLPLSRLYRRTGLIEATAP